MKNKKWTKLKGVGKVQREVKYLSENKTTSKPAFYQVTSTAQTAGYSRTFGINANTL